MYYCPAYDSPTWVSVVGGWLWAVFNMGGPMSRTRKETICSSMLENPISTIQWPRTLRVGIAFPSGVSPREFMNDFIARRGFATPEACKSCVALPSGTYFCRSIEGGEAERIQPESAPPDEVLRAGLILGLCNRYTFNGGRPVLWTDGRLSRTVALYEIGGFYGCD